MQFNSASFLILLAVTFLLYWFYARENRTKQNAILLAASYVFYFSWEPIFLLLIFFTTTITFYGAQVIKRLQNEKHKTMFFRFMVVLVIIPLFLFKYLTFIDGLFISVFDQSGVTNHFIGSDWLMPIGISFYTFKTISYLIEIHRESIEPEKSFVPFSLYISFFSQIMAGPIERPQPFLDQVNVARPFDGDVIKDGLLQMLWGFFKKLVLANSLAPYVNYCFSNSSTLNPSVLTVGAAFFYLQLYFDFSGYTDIAIGAAKLFNIQTIANFKYPLFAINISDYWKRWHISLSSWLNDYVFSPLSVHFRYYRKNGLIISILITFLISGIWHGAGLTFVVWGVIHGLLYVPLILRGQINNSKHEVGPDQTLPTIRQLLLMVLNFIIIILTLVIFKASDLKTAFSYFYRMFQIINWRMPGLNLVSPVIIALIAASIVVDWIGKKHSYSLKLIDSMPRFSKYLVCYVIVVLIIFWGAFENNQFIYNKF